MATPCCSKTGMLRPEDASAGHHSEDRTRGRMTHGPDRIIVLSCIAFFCAASLVAAVSGCNGDRHETGWTVERAESVATIRGMAVRVLQCSGLGTPDETEATRYRRFACEAGARRRGESYDTVAIHYVIRVLRSGDYVLENVRFIGPGVP